MAEPSARFNHVLAPVGVKSFLLSGQTDPFEDPKERDRVASSPSVFDHITNKWTYWKDGINNIGNSRPPGMRCGGFIAHGKNIYWFGGRDDITTGRYNALMKFDTEKFEWIQFPPYINPSSEVPMPKAGCEPVVMDDKFCLFGGYGIPKQGTEIQPESEFHYDDGAYKDRGNTNEFHIYDLKEGVPPRWISGEVSGDRPPPCSYYTLTAVDSKRAVMFAGTTKSGRTNDVYIMTLDGINVHFKKIKRYGPWPKKRSSQAACVLNYGQPFPQLLMTGGLDNNTAPLGDLWLLSVDNGTWIKIAENETYLHRWRPSLSCVSLDNGRKASVLLFGGVDKDGFKLASTTVLEFELIQNSGEVEEWIITNIQVPGAPLEKPDGTKPIETSEDDYPTQAMGDGGASRYV